uniref:SAM domain-containing protein n=1 Tax=Anopheles marajoara TaxID=58244 RepID=A0A2M4BTP2_9DIPT
MGKAAQQLTIDHGKDGITARVGSRTKKAKIVFDPSDHHVPRKRNRRGDADSLTTVTTPKSEPIRTATPSSSSSTDGAHNSTTPSKVSAGRPTTISQPHAAFRHCRICGKNGPGRLPRNSLLTPWTCRSCLGKKQPQTAPTSVHKTKPGKPKRIKQEDETSTVQQQDFAGFSEKEISHHVDEIDQSEAKAENIDRRSLSGAKMKVEIMEEDEEASDDERDMLGDGGGSGSYGSFGLCKEESSQPTTPTVYKEIRLWTCDDVSSYFSRYRQSWGELFLEQEIDGASLLLLQRNDVLSRFGLKLGPAMELYQRIVALQSGECETVDVRLTWM